MRKPLLRTKEDIKVTMTAEEIKSNRTREQVQMDTILTINELQDFVGVLFPWKIAQNDNEVVLSRETIEEIILFIKKLV